MSWRRTPATWNSARGTRRCEGTRAARVSIDEIAATVHYHSHTLPLLRHHLEARGLVDPPGTFSNACHAALVADPGTGEIRVRRYLVVEDCGVVINPLIVDGQVRGGVAQGVAAALYEQIRYAAEGQPVSTTLMDYLVPTAAEMCPVEVLHLETPSAFSETGAKGMGEGGMIGAPGCGAQRGQRRARRDGGQLRPHPGAARAVRARVPAAAPA